MAQLGIRRAVDRIVAPLRRRVLLMVGRAVAQVINDAGGVQVMQLTGLSGEILDQVERLQEYGFTAVPHSGAEAVLVAVGGNRSHSLVIAVEDRRYRLAGLAAGEVALYDDQGQKIVLHRDRIEVTAPTVIVKSDDIHLGDTGGPKVARIGDRVDVGAGSSAGLWPIVEGSDKVRSA